MNIIVASSHLFRRELSCFILSEAGYTVYETRDRAAFSQCLERVRPDLIVLDTRLKGMSTSELDVILNQHKHTTPFVVLGNQNTLPGMAAVSGRMGIAYLTWPYQAEELLVQVQRFLTGSPNAAATSGVSSMTSAFSA